MVFDNGNCNVERVKRNVGFEMWNEWGITTSVLTWKGSATTRAFPLQSERQFTASTLKRKTATAILTWKMESVWN